MIVEGGERRDRIISSRKICSARHARPATLPTMSVSPTTAMYGRGTPSLCVRAPGAGPYFDIVGERDRRHRRTFRIIRRRDRQTRPNALRNDPGASFMTRTAGSRLSDFYDIAFASLTPRLSARRLARTRARRCCVGLELSGGARPRWAKPDTPRWSASGLVPHSMVCGADQRIISGGQGRKNDIIPATATAKVSCRLVPDQVPRGKSQPLFRGPICGESRPPGVNVTLTYVSGGLPYLAPTDHPIFAVAQRAFFRGAFGKTHRLHSRRRVDSLCGATIR